MASVDLGGLVATVPGQYPYGDLVQGSNGLLYGTTLHGGIADFGISFQMALDGSGFTVQHAFTGGAGGANPQAGLIQAADGTFYGTTVYGGTRGLGAIFQVAPDGTGFAVLHDFTGGATDGAYPYAAVIQGSDGMLYGTTHNGGVSDGGTIFQMASDGSGFTVLHSFSGGAMDGVNPPAGLVQANDGTLYGTTQLGGISNQGTVFQISPDGSGFNVVHNFSGGAMDGAGPQAALVQTDDGTLYGTTELGGFSNQGTVFQISDASGFVVLHSFTGGDGANPHADLVHSSDGALYGTTQFGGVGGVGTVFCISADGSGFAVLHSFAGADGAYARAGVMEATNGMLYGTTVSGGYSNGGTIFRIAPDGSGFTVLQSFQGGA